MELTGIAQEKLSMTTEAVPGNVRSNDGLGAWQPIETAPKDQTLIDVWVPTKNGGVRVTDVERTGSDTWGLFEHGNFWEYKNPTHWMPIPAPPVSA